MARNFLERIHANHNNSGKWRHREWLVCPKAVQFFYIYSCSNKKNINSAFKPYLSYILKPIQWHHHHCGGGSSFRGLLPEKWAGWPPCVPGSLGLQQVRFQGSLPCAQLEARASQELPVPALPTRQHWTAILTASACPPAPKAGIPRSQGSWPRHLIPRKISSSVLMLYQDFPFSATSGGGGGKGHANPLRKWASGSRL